MQSTNNSSRCQQVGGNGPAPAFPTPSPKRPRVSNPSHPTTTTGQAWIGAITAIQMGGSEPAEGSDTNSPLGLRLL